MQLPRPEDIHAKALAYLENRYDDLSRIDATSAIETLKHCQLDYQAQIYPEYFSEMGLDASLFITLEPVPYDEETAKVVYNPDHLITKIVIAVNPSCHLLKSMGFCLTLTVKSPISPQEEQAHGQQNYSDVLPV